MSVLFLLFSPMAGLFILFFLSLSHLLPTVAAEPSKIKLRQVVAVLADRMNRAELRISSVDWALIDHLARWKRELRLQLEEAAVSFNLIRKSRQHRFIWSSISDSGKPDGENEEEVSFQSTRPGEKTA